MEQLATKFALAVLNGYRRVISPLLPPACRYVPTCSEFAGEAVERHGILRGTLMAIGRLLRCHPFAKGGYDPVRAWSNEMVSMPLAAAHRRRTDNRTT